MSITREEADFLQERVLRLSAKYPTTKELNADLIEFEKRTKTPLKDTQGKNEAKAQPRTAKERTQALGRLPGGEMNKTEAAYNRLLETRLGTGEIRWFKFEPINIRLGAKCFYSVDFLVMNFDGAIEAHEVKGFWTDDGLAKFKVAAATLPFRFKAVRMVKGIFETILEI